MAIVTILQYPDRRLRRQGEPVTDFGTTLQAVVDDMFETHYAQDNCAALANTQLDFPVPQQITVIDFSPNKDQPLCLINPKIIESTGTQHEEEGCMSVGLYTGMVFGKVKRAASIRVTAQDRAGNPLDFTAEGFMAKCIQHELDHLAGVLFIDRLAETKKDKIKKQLKKQAAAQ
jgi:peptide deformylase